MDKKIKAETLTIRVTPDEKQMIKEIAAEQDITVSKLLYNLIFKKIFNSEAKRD